MKTKEKIINKALEMFNAKGIEYVGLRELAAILGIRVSNITYYFPTKDDLVSCLSAELARENAQIVVEKQDLTVATFLEMLRQVFQNHVRYRCLLLSFVHIMEQNKVLSERYKTTENSRNAVLQSNLSSLKKAEYLMPETDIDFLVSVIALVVRFWSSEAMVSYRHLTTDEQIAHYTGLIARILLPYATPKGKLEIDGFFERLSHN
jgi:AcrR family transcriptional regulator